MSDNLSNLEIIELLKQELEKTKEYLKDTEYNAALARASIEKVEDLAKRLKKHE